jgi:hypothetical protein
MRAGPACQRGRRGEGRVGRRWGDGRWAATGPKTSDEPKFKKNSFRISIDFFRIWQNFKKLYKEI